MQETYALLCCSSTTIPTHKRKTTKFIKRGRLRHLNPGDLFPGLCFTFYIAHLSAVTYADNLNRTMFKELKHFVTTVSR
jgi:hypothetical protein